eukprot:scaffold76667_cov29-Prasinocladus_malaysianus.AAC.1
MSTMPVLIRVILLVLISVDSHNKYRYVRVVPQKRSSWCEYDSGSPLRAQQTKIDWLVGADLN